MVRLYRAYRRKLRPYRSKRKVIKKIVKPKTTFRRKYVAKIAKQVVIKNAEHKLVCYRSVDDITPSNNTGFLATVGTKGFSPLSPFSSVIAVNIGTGRINRIGQRVRTVSLTLKYVIYPMIYNASFNPTPTPLEFCMFIFKNKDKPTDVITSAVPPTSGVDFFEFGGNTEGFTGNLTDVIKSVNKDGYICHRKIRHKLGTASYSGAGTVANQQYYTNNDFKYNQIRTLDLTKYCPKIVYWQDGAAAPNSHLLQMLWFANPADGSSYVGGNSIACGKIFYQIEYRFVDI